MLNAIYQLNSRKYSSFTALDKLVRSILPVRPGNQQTRQCKLLDTFDWRLFTAGYLLQATRAANGHSLLLRSMLAPSTFITHPVNRIPKFHWDIDSGRMRDMLKKMIKERALLDTGTVEVRTQQYELRDELDKILIRLAVTGIYPPQSASSRKGICAWLELHPLRGYEGEAEKIKTRLFEEFQFKYCDMNSVTAIYHYLGQNPGQYSSKMDFTLQQDMPAHSALATVLLYNLDIMERNVKGIKQDIDIEFLHDFRVSNRRSRSLVTRIRNIFPEPALRSYKNTFKWLSKTTSMHRDLDVFLADFAVYENRIPHNGGGELEPLRELLLKSRAQEHKHLLQVLDSRRYTRFEHDWRAFLEGKKETYRPTETGLLPIMDVANKSIWKGYRKLVKQGGAIRTNYTFESIHQLRKDGKKLRYLLEAFRSLYPDKDIASVVSILKKLQNNLGDIVDMHTQRFMLEEWKQDLLHGKSIPADTVRAIDYLENLCNEEEIKAEKKFIKRFDQFSSTSNKKLFLDLFK